MDKKNHIWFTGYKIAMTGFGLAVRFFGLFNTKAALRVRGLSGWQERLATEVNALDPRKKRIWIHCASLGEFELAHPVIKAIRDRGGYHIIVSFFSSSGYEQRKAHSDIDVVTYLPSDSRSNAKSFLRIIKPDHVIFVKYDFWLFYLYRMFEMGIPMSVIGCRFNDKSAFFNELRRLYEPALRQISHWFCQDSRTADFLKERGYKSVYHFGDTRIDRTRSIALEEKTYKQVEAWRARQQTMAMGSIWPTDWKVISSAPVIQSGDLKLFIAPHEISEVFMRQIEKDLPGQCLRYSHMDNVENPAMYRVLIIDNIGHLSYLYRYADMAYVGGAFGAGLHNIYEPLAYKIPVIFGPKTLFFPEADDVIKAGIGHQIDSAEAFQYAYDTLDQLDRQSVEVDIEAFLEPSYHASQRIVEKMNLHTE